MSEDGCAQALIGDEADAWRARSRIVLTPMAAPSVMGMFGFAISALIVGSWQAGWYGSMSTPLLLWPFTLVAGGVAQLVAAAAALRARDSVAVAVHTASGSFWVGWSILQLLTATKVVPPSPPGSRDPSFAIWFVALGAVISMAAFAALSDSVIMAGVLVAFAAANGLSAAGWFAGSTAALHVGGWFLVVAAGLAWYTAGAIMLQEGFGRTVLPLGKYSAAANLPGRSPTAPISYPEGMPGARIGQ